MKCFKCDFKRDINLPYRKEYDDILCCHPDIAQESNWIFAGKIITQSGQTPRWCPIWEPCSDKKKGA